MTTENQQPLKMSLEAASDLSASQYCFVKRDTNGRAVVCTAATDTPIGILQNKPKALGQMAEVVVVGVTKAKFGAGTAFTTNADGVGPYTDGTVQKATALAWSSSTYVAPTKSAVGTLDLANAGVAFAAPAASELTRVIINCASPPTLAT